MRLQNSAQEVEVEKKPTTELLSELNSFIFDGILGCVIVMETKARNGHGINGLQFVIDIILNCHVIILHQVQTDVSKCSGTVCDYSKTESVLSMERYTVCYVGHDSHEEAIYYLGNYDNNVFVEFDKKDKEWKEPERRQYQITWRTRELDNLRRNL